MNTRLQGSTRQWIAALSVSTIVSLCVALASADDWLDPAAGARYADAGQLNPAPSTPERLESPATTDAAGTADPSGSAMILPRMEQAGERAPEQTCMDAEGTTLRPGERGFGRCVQRMKKQQRIGQ